MRQTAAAASCGHGATPTPSFLPSCVLQNSFRPLLRHPMQLLLLHLVRMLLLHPRRMLRMQQQHPVTSFLRACVLQRPVRLLQHQPVNPTAIPNPSFLCGFSAAAACAAAAAASGDPVSSPTPSFMRACVLQRLVRLL